MNDRISLYPGRVTLTPVAGQANTYDLVRADSPTQEGTPLNKASLLKDTTAALYGLTVSAVPDEVLAAIKSLIDAANANANTKAKIQTGSYVGTGTYGSSNPCSLTFDFVPRMVVVVGCFVRSYEVTQSETIVMVNDSNGCSGFVSPPNTATYLQQNITWSGTSVSWYNTSSVIAQLNAPEHSPKYFYVAIG